MSRLSQMRYTAIFVTVPDLDTAVILDKRLEGKVALQNQIIW